MKEGGFPTGWLDLGSQMAQAWQQVIDSWWRALLSDPARLGELARRIFELPQAARKEDLERLVEALELMEKRIDKLEKEQKRFAGLIERRNRKKG